jgi:hypothetical protein
MGPLGIILFLAAAVPAQGAPPAAGRIMASMSVGATVIRPETVSTPRLVRVGHSVLVRRGEGVRVTVEGGSVRPAGAGDAVLVTPGRAERITIVLTY